MPIKLKLGLAGAVLALALVIVLVLALPADAWRASTVAATAVVALLLGSFLYLPAPLSPSARTEASRLALLGPMGSLILLALLLAAAGLGGAILQHDTLSWICTVSSIAAFVTGVLMLSASSNVIDRAVATQPDNSARLQWQDILRNAAGQFRGTPAGDRCEKLAEDLRYTSNAQPGRSTPDDQAIGDKLGELNRLSGIGGAVLAEDLLEEINHLLARRENQLRQSRSRA